MSRKKDVQIQIEISSEEQWEEALSGPGLLVIEVYQRWCGPCKAVQNIFRKLRSEYGDDLLRLAVGEASSLLELSSLKGKCQPVFLFYSVHKLFLEDNHQARKKPPTTQNADIEIDAVVGGQVEGIIQKALDAGFSIVAEEERVLDEEQIHAFYKEKAKEPAFVYWVQKSWMRPKKDSLKVCEPSLQSTM
uniref:Thioredoxin domain-containing protein n=1 Tax=Oncorhynchus tshawytscha TaxID=74940 RepID=A0AAZ3SX88_ONCTS